MLRTVPDGGGLRSPDTDRRLLQGCWQRRAHLDPSVGVGGRKVGGVQLADPPTPTNLEDRKHRHCGGRTRAGIWHAGGPAGPAGPGPGSEPDWAGLCRRRTSKTGFGATAGKADTAQPSYQLRRLAALAEWQPTERRIKSVVGSPRKAVRMAVAGLSKKVTISGRGRLSRLSPLFLHGQKRTPKGLRFHRRHGSIIRPCPHERGKSETEQAPPPQRHRGQGSRP